MSRNATVVRSLVLVVVGAASWMGSLAGPAHVQAAAVYVSKGGNNANDGRSWATAKSTFRAAMLVAATGDEVWVSAGTYSERVVLKAGVSIYGGFVGTETELAQRDWLVNVTILEGAGGSVVTSPSGATSTIHIDGFTLRSGAGTLSGSNRYGGGIYCSNSSPTIANNTITGNTATYGSIYCGSSSSPTIINNTIVGNNVSYGGGVYCDSSSPTIANNTIASNTTSYGGGIYCAKSSSPVIANNGIRGNLGGGIYCDASSPTIANNAIAGNSSSHGGGIYCTSSSPTVANNTIAWNTASSAGGGVSCYNSSPTITNTILAFNSSGITKSGSGAPTLRYNCVFGNTAYDYSGGIADPTGTNGNVKQDPRLVDGAYGNVRIQPDSSCVDAGNDADVQPAWLDLDGQPRIQGGHVDIGADESDGTIGSAGPYIVVRVSPSGDDVGDGQSWATAKRTVQAAINTACMRGGEVWVAAGTYPERITLHAFTYLYGGFAGNEALRDERDWAANITTLDGQAGGSVVTIRTGDRTSTIDGFTIRNGTGTVSGSSIYGGGIYCTASPSITNNRIAESNLSGGDNCYGGGVYCAGGSATITSNTITGNTVSGNTFSYGGGICCSSTSATIANNMITGNNGTGAYVYGAGICCSSASPMITENTVAGNVAAGTTSSLGGGIYCTGGSPAISNNTIKENSVTGSGFGGGIHCESSGPAISNNTIIRNTASSYGGGLCCAASSPTVADNTISDNKAPNGAGIRCSSSSPVISGNTVARNSGMGIRCDSSSPTIVTNTITANGGIGICCGSSSPTITNNLIAANGGCGISCGNSSSPVITNNTIVANSAFLGGGISCDSSSPTIVNTLIAFNLSGVDVRGTRVPTLRGNCVFGNGSYDYSGVADPTGTDGNIKQDPMLADTAYGNYHIQPDSPCIDAGNDADVQTGWLDIDGQSRFQGAHVDIGADESDGTVWPAVQPAIVRVSPSGSDANDGLSWATAKRTVQAGIDTASAQGGEVWVAAGTYLERITLHPYAYVYGGFAVAETERSERSWSTNETTLDGQATGRVVTVTAGYRLSAIDGFTIRNGLGGISCNSSSPTIANNTITGNHGSYGGGVYCSSASPLMTNNRIEDNTATYGGAIHCSSASPMIVNSTIARNAADYGGGICCSSGSPTIMNNIITNNVALHGGGIYGGFYSTIANNVVTLNSAGYGGGIYGDPSQVIVNNTLAGNSAAEGGGIYCSTILPTIINTIVAFNSSGLFQAGAGNSSLRHNCVFGNRTYDYSGCADPTGTGGNIKQDPALAGLNCGNAHIQPHSPCIDAGSDPDAHISWVDLDGQPRFQGEHVDIGADESDGAAWPVVQSVIVRVSPSGDDANDGLSWATSKRTVQAGIDATLASGGEVWVAAGTYLECVTLHPYTGLYGGFAGGETQREQRNRMANVTVLDGQTNSSVVTMRTGERSSVLDGFVIRNGNARSGGGVNCSTSATITNNTVMKNTAVQGGGICCSGGSPIVMNNTIEDNTASGTDARGGGIYCGYAYPMIMDNAVAGNSASSGGGVYTQLASMITGNRIKDNGATDGGGLYCTTSSLIANNRIEANRGTFGGGVYCFSSSIIADNSIVGNQAGSGGGVYCAELLNVIANNTIVRNYAGDGGGIYSVDSLAIVNTIVAFNSTGIYVEIGTATFRSNCVFGNAPYDYSEVHDPVGTDGNISQDPKLAGSDYGNIHILPDSPCVDAGRDEDVRADWRDVDGQPRIQGTHVDIGADESDGTAWAAGPYAIVRVSPSGNDANDGRSWEAPKRTVQAAISSASALGGEVWVAAGTYPERIDLPLYTYVYGGFAGTEDRRDQRSWVANVTTLDGQAAGSVVTATSGYRLSAIDGFTIRNGTGTPSGSDRYGGAIYCNGGSPLIMNDTLVGNTATCGGGIYSSFGSSVIRNTAITENAASSGGGIHFGSGTAMVVNCSIVKNTATETGGGVFCEFSHPTMVGDVILGNIAANGGGIYCGYFALLSMVNGTVVGNLAANGGALYCRPHSYVTGTNSAIAFNSSGIYQESSSYPPTLRSNCVFGNSAYNYSGLTDPTGSKGNISADPLFLNVYAGLDGKWGTADDAFTDLRLQFDSPCIDAGSNADVPMDILIDLAGGPRFLDNPATPDTGSGTPPIVDMGAYEYQPSPPADFDRDGDVDEFDLETFKACITGSEIPFVPADLPDCSLVLGQDGRIAADLDKDGDVDQSDFGVFQRCFSGLNLPADPICGG